MYGPGTGTYLEPTVQTSLKESLPSPSACRRTSSEWTAGVFGFESGEGKARWRGYTEESLACFQNRRQGRTERSPVVTSAANGSRFRWSCGGDGELPTVGRPESK